MKRLWQAIGQLAFWLSYPLSWIYLRIGSRTRVLVVVDDSIVLVKGWLSSGQWELPGGGIHYREATKQGATREVKEETGVSLSVDQLKYFYQAQTRHKGLRFSYTCFYVQLAKRPQLKKRGLEITEVAWLPLKSVTLKNSSLDTYQAVQDWLKR